jgi:hypothetical protein
VISFWLYAAFALRQDVRRGSFARAGIGWVHATHQGAPEILFSTAFDTGPWASIAGGKEWTKMKDYGERIVGVSGNIHWRQGTLAQEIDLEGSRTAGYTIYADEGNYIMELDDYIRLDLRLYLRQGRSNKTVTWSLDIQNVTSRENAFFPVYDPYLDAIRETTQLGIIPVLSYRVDF